MLPFRCSDCDGEAWLDSNRIAGLVDAGMCPYCETGMLPAMLENPRVTKTKFQPRETRLEGATVVGSCTIKGRVSAAIGLVLVDLNDERFVAYAYGDHMVIIPEEPDAKTDAEQQEESAQEEADSETQREGWQDNDADDEA